MSRIRKTITESVQLRSQSEIARVEARVQTRKKLGSEKWEEMIKLQTRLRQQQNRTTPTGGTSPNTNHGTSNPRN